MKIVYYLISCLFFIGSYRTYVGENYDIKHGTYLELGDYKIFVFIFLIIIASYFIYLAKKQKNK